MSEICSRAGVSHGAIFCQFDSRLDWIAAAEEIGRRQVASVRAEFENAATRGETDILARVIRFMDASAQWSQFKLRPFTMFSNAFPMEVAVAPHTRRRGARRTQQERREATVGKLLDATIDALADVGYARTSVSEICSRAGVSHGAIFCHFDSRLDLIAAAAEEIGRRQVASVRAEFENAATRGETDILARVIRFMDAAAHSQTNAVFPELLVASRTDEGLRPAMRRVMLRYSKQIENAAAELFEREEYDPRVFRSAVWGLVALFSGLALTEPLGLGESTPRSDIVRLAPEISRLMLNGMAGGTAPTPDARRRTRRATATVASKNPGTSARKAGGKGRSNSRKGTSKR